jgi:hypothetical protein
LPTAAPPSAPATRRLPLGLVLALEGVALLLGLYLALRRRGERLADDAPDTEAA